MDAHFDSDSSQVEGARDIELEQSRLRRDIAVVRAFGESNPDTWVDVVFENEPSVRLIAYFHAENIQELESALRRLVANPDLLDVRWLPIPRSCLEEINTEVRALATNEEMGSFSSVGIGRGKLNIRLRAGSASLAARLLEQYGDALDIGVGFMKFPACTPLHLASTGQRAIASTRESLPLLKEIDVMTDVDLSVKSGAHHTATVRIENRGREVAVVTSNGGITARVLEPASGDVVGGFDGVQHAPLFRHRIAPNDAVEIPLLIGTASTVPSLGYAVPPGRWAFDMIIKLEGRGTFRSPPRPIRITA